MPQLPRPKSNRKRKKSADDNSSPSRKRIKHVTKKRLSQIYEIDESEVQKRSQEVQEKAKDILDEELPEREALNLLRESDLDVPKAVAALVSQSQGDDNDEQDGPGPMADVEEDSLEDKMPPPKKKKRKVRIQEEEEEIDGVEVDEKVGELEDPLDPIENEEEEVEPANIDDDVPEWSELPDVENEAKQRNLTHYLSAKFTQNALAVFKDCVTVVAKIQGGNDAIVMKIDSKEKKVKFWCRSSGIKNDVLEFVFENKANPRCFREFQYFADRDRAEDPWTFELAVPLKNLQTIARKINTKKHILTMDFHNDLEPGRSLVRFKFESIDDSTRFDFTLKKIDVQAHDPMLSQFHSVKESQDPYTASQEMDKSIHEEDALVTLWTSTKKFKDAHAMFSGVSDIISFQIHRMRPDTQELSEDPDDDKFEVRLKSKGDDGDIVSKTRLPLRGGPNLKSIHVKKGKEIKENINVDLPTDMVGKILNLKFIHNIVKIDFYEVDKVRFIFKFARSKCQGRLYYNVDPYPEYIDPDLEEMANLEAEAKISDKEEDDFLESQDAQDPLADSEKMENSAPVAKGKSPNRKSPRRRKRKRLRNSLSAQIDQALSDDEVNE